MNQLFGRAREMSLAVLPLVAALLVAALLPSPALAQVHQICLALNEGGAGNEYLYVTTKGGLEGNSAYTIEAWVNPDSWANYPTIVGNDFTVSYWLGLNTTGKVRFYPRGASFVESAGTVPLNTWTHVAAVYNAATGWSIYLNGTLDASSASITGAVGTSPQELRIGADRAAGSPNFFWHGYLDEIRIWSSARTGPEIRETMYTGPGRPSAFTNGYYNALQACWTTENPFVDALTDRSGGVGNPFNQAQCANGDASTETTINDPSGPPVAPNVGLQLNGIDDRLVLPVSENFTRGVTVMAWIAPTTFSNFPTIAGRDYTSSFWLGITTDGRLRFYPRGGTAVDSPPSINADHWQHVAATYDGTRTILYVNGQVKTVSTAVTGPVGANGRDVWIGADNEPGGPAFAFQGYLDEVKVVQGALSSSAVRAQMFQGFPQYVSSFEVPDQDGVPVTLYHVSMDLQETFTILGTGARIARGGTAALNPTMPMTSPSGFQCHVLGGLALPDDDIAGSLGTDLVFTTPLTVSQVEVFISAALNNLSDTRITLRSPAGTVRELLTRGDARGRDLLTVISDSGTETWAEGASPYTNGVRPSQALSAFAGQGVSGVWRIELLGSLPATRVGLWTWGLRLNGLRSDVAAGQPAGGTALEPQLRLAGPNPIAGTSALAFDLPRAARVDLAIYDVRGREVRRILAGGQQPGSFLMNFSTEGLGAGVYFATLQVDGASRGHVKLTVLP